MQQEMSLFGVKVRKGGSILLQLEFLNAFNMPMLSVEDIIRSSRFLRNIITYVSTQMYDVAFQKSVVHSLYEVLSKSPEIGRPRQNHL